MWLVEGDFSSLHAQHALFQKCVDVSCFIMLPSLPARLADALGGHPWPRSALEPSPCFVGQQLIQTGTFGASHHECTLLFCTPLLSYWEEDQYNNGDVRGPVLGAKKAPRSLGKQIFLHVISKSSIRLSNVPSKGKILLFFVSLAFK